MPLALPDLTLVVIDSVAHALTRQALEETLAQIQPKEVIVFTNDRELVRNIGKHCFETYRVTLVNRPTNSMLEVARCLWYEVAPHVATSHVLTIQYDGFVLDSSLWRPEFLDYDYIGAPWLWHEPNRQVGNGGFSLRSVRLMRRVASRPELFSLHNHLAEDEWLCRIYRPLLEQQGFKWAPVELAQAFSFEREPWRRTFGFHGAFNLPQVLDRASLELRLNAASDYVKATPNWQEMLKGLVR